MQGAGTVETNKGFPVTRSTRRSDGQRAETNKGFRFDAEHSGLLHSQFSF